MSDSGHLLILVEGFYPQTGGGAQSQWQVAREAVDDDYRVSVFTPRIENTPRYEAVDGVEIHRPFPGSPDPNNLNTVIGISLRLLFDVLILPYLILWCWYNKPKVIYSSSHLLHPVAKVLSLLYKLPVINFVAYSPILREENTSKYDPRRIFESINFYYFMGDVVFTRTPRVAEVLNRTSNCTVCQAHGVLDEQDIRSINFNCHTEKVEQVGIPSGCEIICWVGRVVPIKRPTLSLEILQSLPPEYHLVIVGDGPSMQDLKHEVSPEINERVHFVGLVSHREALQWIGLSDALLLTSETEAYPTVVFEALATHTPVFATKVGILPTISEEKLFVMDPKDISQEIENQSAESMLKINEEVVSRYSISRFANDIITQIDHFEDDKT